MTSPSRKKISPLGKMARPSKDDLFMEAESTTPPVPAPQAPASPPGHSAPPAPDPVPRPDPSGSGGEGSQRSTVYIRKSYYRQLKILAASRGKTIKDLLDEAVYDYFTKNGIIKIEVESFSGSIEP